MLVSCKQIKKIQGENLVLDNIELNIEDNDKIAIVGVNGTGKSTLLNIVAKKTDYQGEIIYKKDLRIAMLDQNPQFEGTKTINQVIRDNLQEGVNEYELKAIVTKFGLDSHEQKISHLSGGQIKRLALALVLVQPCDLLILDEPTNHLDNKMIDFLEKYLIRFNKGVLLVTHDRYFLERVTNKIIEIDQSQLYLYPGNYENYLEMKQDRTAAMISAQHKRKQFLKKELEWVRAGVQARSTKQKSRLERFEQLSNVSDVQQGKDIEIFEKTTRLGKKTIELVDISKSYEKKLFESFSYNFQRYDRIGILGDNGTGKSTLLNIIAKIIEPDSGEVIHGSTLNIGYFKQGIHDLDLNLKVREYIDRISLNLATDQGVIASNDLLEQFNFDKKLQHTLIARLSGGQKRRLYLLAILMQGPNVLILDEPTNDLDIQTMATLEDFLDSFPGIVITVSHDRYFLDRVCSGLFVIKNHHITYMNGGYSQNVDSFTTVVKDKKEAYTNQKEQTRKTKLKLSYQQKKDLDSLPNDIDQLENEIAAIDESLSSTTDFGEIETLASRREELHESLEQKSDYYFELLEIQEEIEGNQ